MSAQGKKMPKTVVYESAIARSGITWEQFVSIRNAFTGIAGIRLQYCAGVLEIMPLSKAHEFIVALLTAYLHIYFVHKRLVFFPSGAYSQKIEGITEYQSDLSYSFGSDKDVPDLCIEVVLTSGGTDKLHKYQLRGVPEVWFWQDGRITVYYLQNGNYELRDRSELLPELDLAFLAECINQDDPLQASLKFQQRYA